MKRKTLSWLLVFCLIVSLLPVSALAAEGGPDAGTPVASAVSALQARIDALPDADTLAEMDTETQDEVYTEICALSDAIDELTDEEAEALDMSALEEAAAFFTRQAMKLTTPDDGKDESLPAGTLDIANGSILITSTGYSQGTLTQNSSTWSVKDSEGNTVTETKWDTVDTTHALTITGTATSSTAPYIFVRSGNVSITLKDVTASISAPSTNTNIPAIAIYQGAQAAITLEGTSTLISGTKAVGVQVAGNGGSLTISGDGTLNSTIGSAFVKDYANTNNYHRGGGKLTVEGGTINGNILDKNGGLEVEINGGTVNGSITNSEAWTGKNGNTNIYTALNTKVTAGIVTGAITCKNGNVTISGGTVQGAITCSSGTVSITGGNINTGYTKTISGRTLTRLYFVDENGNALANKKVSVTEGTGEDAKTWTALTNSKGIITTYLASATTSVTAKVGDASESSTATITGGKGLFGASCTCGGENLGTLTMGTKSQSITSINGSAALALTASYTHGADCKAPDGFHGDYEKISYEIVSVTRNGQFVTADRYAAIDGNTLTVYGDVDQDAYAVKVRAVCGPEGSNVYSKPITVTVGTYVSSVDEEENTLDIALGSITVSAGTGENSSQTVYTQGEKTISVDANTTVTITGTDEYSANNAVEHYIRIEGGSPTIELKDLTIIQNGSFTPAIVLMSGTSTDDNTATLILSGTNTLSGASQAPAVQINKNATLTIRGEGTLNATGTNNVSAIGAPRNNAYAINPTTKQADNSYRSGGNLIIEGGTINATGSDTGASIGASYGTTFGNITIKGGVVNALRTNIGSGISTRTNASSGGGSVTIEGGVVNAKSRSGSNQKYDAIHAEGGFSMTGGTLGSLTLIGSTDGVNYISVGTGNGVGVSITGGNVNGYYTGTESNCRVLTKLYFVTEDGSPVANTEVTVTEGTGDNAKTWTALTNDKGVITTYFASDTDSISVSYGNQSNVDAEIKAHQALIGGTCICSDFTGITWDSGLPGSVTLYDESESTYSVADAALVVDSDCSMPIHPNLTAISYSLSVTANGSTVDESSTSTYAALENGALTLKPASAPYTVTLTATAGDKTATQTVQVRKSTAEEGVTTIDLSKGNVTISYNSETNTYSYTQGSNEKSTTATANILLTGNAASATVTVNGGSPNLTVNQNSVDDVWAIYASDEATDLTLDAQTVNGKVRFGESGSVQAALSYISSDKVKLNPDSGDITFDKSGGVQQGKFTVSALDKRELSVMGADTEAARSITNKRSEALTLTVNNEEVTLKSGGVHTIKKALGSKQNAAGTCKTYLLTGGRAVYENYNAATNYYDRCLVSGSGKELEGYRLIAVGEGDAEAGNFKGEFFIEKEEGATYEDYYTQSRISEVELDPDLDGTLQAGGFLYEVRLKELHAEYVSNIAVYTSALGDLYVGENLSSFTWGNYCTTTGIHVPESNPHFAVDDAENGGVLYTKDFSTLLLIPAGRTANYTVRKECTTIKANATMQCHVGAMTIGKNVSYIGGTYIFFSNWVNEFRVESGNKYFAAKDGILYSADMTRMVAYPRAKKDTVLTIPSTVTYVESLILAGTPIETLLVEEGAAITGDQVGLGRLFSLKEVTLAGSYAGRFDGAKMLEKMTVYDGFNFSQDLATCSMDWIKAAGITISGVSKGENIPYDGNAHGITVATTATDATVEYSADGVNYSAEAPAYTEPGTYTVYWRITKAADASYNFARELYSSRTFTISALEASEDWFTLTTVGTSDTNPVTLSQPAAAPSLKNGYTVKYSKGGTGEATETEPEEAGKYLVTVDITAEGYAKETLTLGYYTILSEAQSGSVVLSFITYGGNAIEPIIWSSGESDDKIAPDNPKRNGYTFAGWYTDTSLHSKATLGENNSISKPAASTTWYAQWTRNTYTITYSGLYGAKNNNPTTYTVESPAFTLNAPVLAGYLFKGWKSNSDTKPDPSSSVTIEHGSYGDKTYTAVWEKIQYTIAYTNHTDGVESNPTSYTVDDTASKGLSLTAPTAREGYTFSGWQMTVDGVTYILPAKNAKIPQGTVGNIVLSGIWMAEGQKLTLNANGGAFADGTSTMTITADYASSITLTQPTRSGYAFAGWYADSNLETPFEASTMPLSTTIYAKWTKNSSSGGGSGIVMPGVRKPEVSAGEGVKVTLSKDGTTAKIEVEEGYEISDVTVNGVSQGKITEVTGLKTGDKLVVVAVKKAADESAIDKERIIKGVQNTKVWITKTSKGKGWIKINYKKSKGYKVDYYEVYRKTGKNGKFGSKPFYKTKKNGLTGWYKNTKSLKKGTRYYYKVRGVRIIDGKKYYTKWSKTYYRIAK